MRTDKHRAKETVNIERVLNDYYVDYLPSSLSRILLLIKCVSSDITLNTALDTRVSTVHHNAVQTQIVRLRVLRTAVLVMLRCLAAGRDSPKRPIPTSGTKTTITHCQTAQLHNSSSQPRPVECGRVTRQHRSLNGYNCVFILTRGEGKTD